MADQTGIEPQPAEDDGKDQAMEELRIKKAFLLAVIGLGLSAALAVMLVLLKVAASEITSLIGLFTGVLGTLVGTFFGLQVGSSGKERADSRAKLAQKHLNAVLLSAGADPKIAGQIRQSHPDLFR